MKKSITIFVAANAIIKKIEKGVVKILLVQQARPESKKGLWGLPGGKIEEGESFEEGLIREVFEEVGIKKDSYDYRFIKILHDLPHVTCKHIYEVNLKELVDITIDTNEIMNTQWIDAKTDLDSIPFRASWVQPLLKECL